MANRLLLDNYIQSYGVDIPKDWTYYQTGHQHESECVLCHEQHDFIELFIYNPQNPSYRRGTGAYVCEDCQVGIENSLLRIQYPEFSENYHLVPPEHTVVNEIRDRRVLGFNQLYTFDNSVKLRYNHLRHTHDSYILKDDPNKCYFCEVLINTSKVVKIKVPVEHAEEMSGGIVKCCDDCFKLIDVELLKPDINSIWTLSKSKCSNCSVDYWITEEEAAFRLSSRNTGRLCPECAYEEIDRVVNPRNLLFMPENAGIRKFPMQRFKICRCDYCMSNFTIDLTVATVRNLLHQISDKRICLECRLLYPQYTEEISFVYKHSHHIWAIFYKRNNYWGYTIIKVHTNRRDSIEELVKTTAENMIETLPEAVSIASEECYNLIEGKQLNLWEDDQTQYES